MKVSYINALYNTKFTSAFRKYPVSGFTNPIETVGMQDKSDYEYVKQELKRRGDELYKAIGRSKKDSRKNDYIETPNSFVQVYRSEEDSILKEARYSTGNHETYFFDKNGNLKRVLSYNDAKKIITEFNYSGKTIY